MDKDLSALQYIAYTRYYKGEKNSPFVRIDQNKTMLWFYEKAWVDSRGGECGDFDLFVRYVADRIPKGSGIPIKLISLIFDRYSHTSYDSTSDENISRFVDFFTKYYIK